MALSLGTNAVVVTRVHLHFTTCGWIRGKQSRPWSGVAFCGVWSKSTLFALTNLSDDRVNTVKDQRRHWAISSGHTCIRPPNSQCGLHRIHETHYENTPIQIYRKFHLQKTENFQIKKKLWFFIFLLKT